jgi:hypothetical protein
MEFERHLLKNKVRFIAGRVDHPQTNGKHVRTCAGLLQLTLIAGSEERVCSLPLVHTPGGNLTLT